MGVDLRAEPAQRQRRRGPALDEGDNEVTGIHVSDSDPSANGVLGAKVLRFGHDGWRMFWTQQHGDNVTWEVTRAKHGDNDDDHDDW